MNTYKILNKQTFVKGNYSLIPIRMEDRFDIMKWRNEQIYHLRQNKPLTEKEQEKYFHEVILSLFDQDFPNQILFSFLNGSKCIGYGGIVHINWIDRNAEISFIMDTSLEIDFFDQNWTTFLSLIEEVAFNQINLHKIFIYAFDLRPRLYEVLEKNRYFSDAVLKDHVWYKNKFIDVVIYSKMEIL